MPLLSIIVPHHNHLGSLPGLFDRIMAQSFKDLEVLLVDDCSAESCRPLVEAYRSKGLDVRLFEHSERIYTMKARLLGMREARGEIVGFADADDLLWGCEALERNVEIFLSGQPDILHFRTAIIDEAGKFVRWTPQSDDLAPLLEGEEIFRRYAAVPDFFSVSSVWNKFFSRELCRKILQDMPQTKVLRYLEDCYICTLAMFKARKYVGSPHVGYGYRYNEPAKYAQAHERAVYNWHALRELTPWLRERGCPPDSLENCRKGFLKQLCISAGHTAQEAVRTSASQDGTDIADETVDQLLQLTDPYTLIKTLLAGNAMNANKVLGVLRAVRDV